MVSLCFAVAFIGPIYFDSYAIRTAFIVLSQPLIVFGFAALLHFLLSFPEPKPWLKKKNALLILYAPALLLTVYILFLVLVQPDGTSVLNTINNIVFGLFMLSYFGLSIIVMVRTYLKASSQKRKIYGLNIMAAGSVLALLPFVIFIGVRIVAPAVILPGNDFLLLSFILLPLSFAYAVMKSLSLAEDAPARETLDEQMA